MRPGSRGQDPPFGLASRACRIATLVFASSLASLTSLRGAFATPQEAVSPPSDPAAGVIDRVAVVGASVSNGFGFGLPLAAVVDYALKPRHETVLDLSNGAMFMDPLGTGEHAIDRCLEHDPTLVIGIDFLFWYACSVPSRGEDERTERNENLDLGLAQLDRLRCPLVVGDIPDLHDAKSARLPVKLMPTVDVLVELNARIRGWAERKPNVDLVPLGEWVASLKAGTWSVQGSPSGGEGPTLLSPERAMQSDRIHPTAFGCLVLAEKLVERVRERHGIDAAAFGIDIWKAAAALPGARDAVVALTVDRAVAEAAASGGKTVVLVRHAEKAAAPAEGSPDDPALSDAGHTRAQSLRRALERSGASLLLASEYRRTEQTLAPLAEAIGGKVEIVPAKDLDALVRRIEAAPERATIVVAGHSNTVPPIAARLGVKVRNVVTSGGAQSLADSEFDRLFVITIPAPGAGGSPELIELRYGP